MNGAQRVARVLHELGATTVFGVSGNQILSLLDALIDADVRTVHTRHENGAVYMAEAWAQICGRPGVALLTAGPGVTTGLTGLASARWSETPVLALAGASPISQRGRGAFQEMPQAAIAGHVCKAAAEVATVAETGDAVAAAWERAAESPPGPVFLSLPVDVLEAEASAERPFAALRQGVQRQDRPLAADVEEVVRRVMGARQVAVLVRPSVARSAARLVTRLEGLIPTFVVESPRGVQDPRWVGDRHDYLAGADLVLLLAPSDFAVGGGTPAKHAATVQVGADAQAMREGPDLSIVADERRFLESLVPALEGVMPERRAPVSGPPPAGSGKTLHPLVIGEELRPLLRADDILVFDGGEFGQWMRLAFRDLPHRQVINGKLGAIGSSIPHAVGAASTADHGRVFAFVGDGAFGYYAAEIDTAAREQLPITVIVGNDRRWGAEWHLQRVRYGEERANGTLLQPRDYELVAKGYGARGYSARTRQELKDCLSTAVKGGDQTVSCVNVWVESVPSSAAEALAARPGPVS